MNYELYYHRHITGWDVITGVRTKDVDKQKQLQQLDYDVYKRLGIPVKFKYFGGGFADKSRIGKTWIRVNENPMSHRAIEIKIRGNEYEVCDTPHFSRRTPAALGLWEAVNYPYTISPRVGGLAVVSFTAYGIVIDSGVCPLAEALTRAWLMLPDDITERAASQYRAWIEGETE